MGAKLGFYVLCGGWIIEVVTTVFIVMSFDITVSDSMAAVRLAGGPLPTGRAFGTCHVMWF